MATQLTPEQLRAIFTGTSLSLTYYDTVRLYNRLNVHANGDVPIWLIRNARPNESEAVCQYRNQIYEPETQNPIERVLGVLKKIRRSPDWMMRFDSEPPAIINKDEVLEKYLSEDYPMYIEFENWLFEEALRNIALDANAVVVVMPEDLTILPNQYTKPIAQIFNADKVLQYVCEDYCVIKSDELSSLLTPDQQRQRIVAMQNLTYSASNPTTTNGYNSNNGQYGHGYQPTFYPGQVYYFINTNVYQRWEETAEGKYQLTKTLIHGLNELPVFQLPGEFLKRVGSYVVKRSLLNPMVPHLNKAARESNDLDAGVIMHLFLEKWRINNVECKKCKGTGVVPGNAGPTTCGQCKGAGVATGKSPFDEIIIKPAGVGQQNVPIPPVGYVDKNSDILKLQNDRIEKHIFRALESVNMEHLSDVQLNQSGVAKEFDRDEANAIVYSFATFLAFVANTSIYYMAKLRYGKLVTDTETFNQLLPVVPVPEKFDVINTTFLLAEYQSAKTAGVNSTILAELQKEIAEKKFYANPKVGDYVKTVMEVDPFPDKTIEEKALLEGQGLVTKTDIVLSSYISDFVKQAVEENPNFSTLKYKEKRAILLKYANEKVKELSQANQVMQDILQSNVQPGNNNDQNGANPNTDPTQNPNGNGNGIQQTQQQQELRNFSSQVSTLKRLGNTNI